MHALTDSSVPRHSGSLKSAAFSPLFVDAPSTLDPREPASGLGFVRDRGDAAESPETAPAVHLCRQVVFDAARCHAREIHFEPGPLELRVRLSADGVERDHLQLPGWMHASLVTAIKRLARLDPLQQYRPQHGRVTITGLNCSINVRVSTAPTEFGEKVVLRLVSSDTPSLSTLGFSVGQRVLIEHALGQPQGLIVVAGPAGAGKSTTLRSLLAHSRPPAANVLVTEIRDAETARLAFEQSQTGQVLLTSIQVNNSLQAIERLLSVGVAPSLVSSAINMIIVQRLARRTCAGCREPYEPSPHVLRWLKIDALRLFERGRGCVRCGHTGYSGRLAIFEVVNLTRRFRHSITENPPQPPARRGSSGVGGRFLLDDGLDKTYRGLTTVEEVMRVMRNEPVGNTPATALFDSGANHRVPLGRLAS